MFFKDVIGQTDIKNKLAELAVNNRLPHAMMFLGPEGNGALPMALALAQYINCENKQGNDSCGTCPSCAKTQKYIHPDVHFTYPTITGKSGGKPPVSADFIQEWRSALLQNPYMSYNEWLNNLEAENKQGNITVNECHEIIRRINLKTYESTYKIQIIWLAEFLREAGNTLLKVIEEPPSDTIFILIVENAELVLNTILSRTQIVRINAVQDEDIKEGLLSKYDMDESTAKRISRIADGNFNLAMNIAGGETGDNSQELRKWLGCCFNLKQRPSSDNSVKLFDWIDAFSKAGRENQKIFFKYALFFLRECTFIALTGHSEKLDGDELTFAKNLSAKLGVEQVEQLNKLINNVHYYVERNANPKILFTSASFKVASIFLGQEVEV